MEGVEAAMVLAAVHLKTPAKRAAVTVAVVVYQETPAKDVQQQPHFDESLLKFGLIVKL